MMLSPFQKAVLTQLNIPVYALRNGNGRDNSEDHPSPEKTLKSQSSAQPKDRQSDSLRLQQIKQNLTTNQRVEIAGKALIHFKQHQVPDKLLSDVLLAVGITANDVVFAKNDKTHYQGQQLEWSLGQQLSYQSKVLTTPAGEELQQAKVKRQLWQLLCQGVNRD